MASSYPGALDSSFPQYPYADNTDYITAVTADAWVQAIQAIEGTLGYGTGSVAANPLYSTTYPAVSPFTTVTARIAHLEAQTVAAIGVDTAVGDYQPVGNTTATGGTGKAADAGHIHQGVRSFNTRTGIVTSQASDFGASFSAAGALIVGTGNGTSEQLSVGAAGTVLTVQTGDPSGLAWATPQGWASGDLRFTSATSWTAAWIPADGTQISRSTYAALLTASTISLTGTVSGNTISGLTSATTNKLTTGMSIEGPGLGVSVTITNVSTTSIQTSSNPSGGSQTFTVFPYGNGNGSTTFQTIDMRGRTAVGTGGVGTNAQPTYAIGATGGEQNHSLSTAELAQHLHGITDPGHTHPISDPTHAHNGSTVNEQGTHVHNFSGNQYVLIVASSSLHLATSGANPVSFDSPYTETGSELESHYHSFSTAGASTGVTTQNAQTGITTQNVGTGQGHNNMQPFAVGQWLVKI
jgi:microcystin-dependent protein